MGIRPFEPFDNPGDGYRMLVVVHRGRVMRDDGYRKQGDHDHQTCESMHTELSFGRCPFVKLLPFSSESRAREVLLCRLSAEGYINERSPRDASERLGVRDSELEHSTRSVRVFSRETFRTRALSPANGLDDAAMMDESCGERLIGFWQYRCRKDHRARRRERERCDLFEIALQHRAPRELDDTGMECLVQIHVLGKGLDRQSLKRLHLRAEMPQSVDVTVAGQ